MKACPAKPSWCAARACKPQTSAAWYTSPRWARPMCWKNQRRSISAKFRRLPWAKPAQITSPSAAPDPPISPRTAPAQRPANTHSGEWLSEECLLRHRHRKLRALLDALRPALHDRLLLGVEAHPFGAVGMHVAEQAFLPATKAVPGHRHRDRYVDADHAHFDTPREFAGDVAVAGEAADAVAELVVVDQFYGLGKVIHADTGQHRAEDFFAVDAHLFSHVVEQGRAKPEAVFQARFGRHVITPVEQQVRAGLDALFDVAADAFQRGARDNRAHFGLEVAAVGDAQCLGPLGQGGDDFVFFF